MGKDREQLAIAFYLQVQMLWSKQVKNGSCDDMKLQNRIFHGVGTLTWHFAISLEEPEREEACRYEILGGGFCS